jgi:hypothetical protein
MENYICLNCGIEFKGKKSAARKFCCKKCSDEYRKGKENPKLSKKVEVTCAMCGKIELVPPCRAKNYLCCSKSCLGEYRKSQHVGQIECTCPICGTVFWVKPSRVKRVKTTICCSKQCSSKLKETTYLGENNHQYGLTGNKNASFKGNEIISNYGYILEYCPGHPKPCDTANQCTRVRQHRLVIERNYEKFDPCYFEEIDGWVVLKDEYDIHHINEIKTDNRLENLQILTRDEHTALHNTIRSQRASKYSKIIGVIKQGELLESPEVDNQQPNLSGNTFEGSETSSRVLRDSNTATSALLQQILDIVEEDIVRPTQITEKESVELEDKEPLS